MKIALIGVGAVGTIIASHLANDSIELYLVDCLEETYKALKNRGLIVSGKCGEFLTTDNYIPLERITELPAEIDYAIITTKLPAVKGVVEKLESHIKTEYSLVLMTNGVIEEEISKKIDPKRILGCVISFGASKIGPAHSEMTSKGEIALGRVSGEKQKEDKQLERILKKIAPTCWSHNIIGCKFSKLLINSAITSFLVISGVTLGEILKHHIVRLAFLTNITEGVHVAKAHNIKLTRMNGLNFRFLSLKKRELSGFSISLSIKHLILKIIGRKYKELYSSNSRSLKMGKKPKLTI